MPSSPAPSPVVVISDTESGGDGDGDAVSDALSGPAAERIASTLITQAAVDALCEKYGVPGEFTRRPAGELRACSVPPPGAVCVYAHALEAGVRFPLHAFLRKALTHFRLAPGQLTPNGWLVLVGFVVLCHEAGVRPSMTLFRHFFSLSTWKNGSGWYFFRSRGRGAGPTLFTGLSCSKYESEWKGGFFFLTSPEQWPCPVSWGEPPSKRSVPDPVLTSQQKQSADKLLEAHGVPLGLRAYLRNANLAAVFSSNPAGTSSPPQPRSPAKGVDPPVRDMTDNMPVEKTAAPAAGTEEVKSEVHGDTLPLSGNKRKREEASAKDGLGSAAPVSDPRSPHSAVPDTHDGDTADWKVARKVLESIVTQSRVDKLAASKPSDVVASSYVAMLQAANYASFTSGYALDLEEKLVARERDNMALWEQLDKEKAARQAAEAELEAVKRATEAELESAKTAAVQQFIGSEEHKRRLAQHALAGYERGAEEMKGVVLRHYPRLDAAKLVMPLK
ncbi:uncharacterized protein LOC123410107 [Hordeum vulgare subsp. vulgare]|uniref:uncharacterized protein LOC123410107 n=1 Tax=Hordeum vulgare subsp. vulgare TaxID=112509 RepID=UPI001B8566D0|nr:uncharacterized protein LOC123410107 [Hordeum vulgare subsp. vulgare]